MARPIPSRPLRLNDAGREAWAEYLARNKVAREQYAATNAPRATRWDRRKPCLHCGKTTWSVVGVCKACRGASS